MRLFLYLLTLILTSILGYGQNFTKQQIQVDQDIQADLYIGDPTSKTVSIIIAGSGPTDRNGNYIPGLHTNAYKYLAEDLAKAKQNILTFDKRAVALSKRQQGSEQEGVFQDNVTDLQLVIQSVQDRFDTVNLIGHSEGALVGLLEATNPKVSKYISISGPGETIDKIISKQIASSAPFLQTKSDSILNELRKGNTVEDVIPMLQSIYRPSVQPYLISWMQIDPTQEISKLNKPILLIQGDKDLQVDIDQGQLLHKANTESILTTIKGMNHVLKSVDTQQENMMSYTNGSLPVHPELVTVILNFLKQ